MSEIRNERKTKVGKVVSDKMEKTIVVAVVDTESHPLYKKSVKKTVKFKAHDENNEAHVGDTVSIRKLFFVLYLKINVGDSLKFLKEQNNLLLDIEF